MTLLQKIRTLGYAVLLALTPAQMNCSELSSCTTDLDCKESRVCEYNPDLEGMFCMTPEEVQEARAQPTGEGESCQSSEFYHTNLWEVANSHTWGCEMGTIEPLREDCTGILGGSERSDSGEEPFTYFGNTLHFPGFVNHTTNPADFTHGVRNGADPFEYVTLQHNPAASDLCSFEECYATVVGEEGEGYYRTLWNIEVNRFLCYFEKDPSLYWGKTEYPRVLYVWRKTLEPWTNRNDCLAVETVKPYFVDCNELFAYPDYFYWGCLTYDDDCREGYYCSPNVQLCLPDEFQ